LCDLTSLLTTYEERSDLLLEESTSIVERLDILIEVGLVLELLLFHRRREAMSTRAPMLVQQLGLSQQAEVDPQGTQLLGGQLAFL
jgi:hypothetical protein